MTTILRCPRCWRECAGIRCPECAIGTALVDLADSIGAEGVATQQHAVAAARRAERTSATQLDLFGSITPPTTVPDLFTYCPTEADIHAARVSDYQSRREAKAARFHQYADNAARRSSAAINRATSITDRIPMGQPILVGHHSERHHRRDIERSDSAMRRGIEENKKAAYWQRRAEAVENDTSIRRDDPEACDKLRAKIAELTAKLDRIKQINAYGRKHKSLDGIEPPLTDQEAHKLDMCHRYSGSSGYEYPAYATTNLRGNLRRYQERLKVLSQ